MLLIPLLSLIEFDLPRFKKFLFCLPLRPGLVFWGIVQMIETVLIGVFTTQDFTQRSSHYNGFVWFQMIAFYIASMIVSLLEGIFCCYLFIGAQKKNPKFLGVCYNYLKIKVFVYAGILIVCFIVTVSMHSDVWFYRNLDALRNLKLHDNIALGIIDWALTVYILLLVRSAIELSAPEPAPPLHTPSTPSAPTTPSAHREERFEKAAEVC